MDYHTLRTFEGDFDKAQAEFRRAAAIWVIGTFSALGYIVVPASGDIEMNRLASSFVLLGAIGNLGFFALWWVDQFTYQRLLHSIFVYGLFVEWTNRERAMLRPRAALFARNRNISGKLSAFYLVPMAALFAIQLTGIWLHDPAAPADQVSALLFGGAAWGLVLLNTAIMGFVVAIILRQRDLIGDMARDYPAAFRHFAADPEAVAALAAEPILLEGETPEAPPPPTAG
ncbi:MAG: hypothetical protein AAFT19_05170 [Pseudomonadota bacterium]